MTDDALYDPFTGMQLPGAMPQDRPVSINEAYGMAGQAMPYMGGLASMGDYDWRQPSRMTGYQAYDQLARERAERAADPLNRAALPNATLTEAGIDAPETNVPLGVQRDVSTNMAGAIAPQTPLDWAMLATGGVPGWVAKGTLLGLGAAFDPGEAEAGTGNFARRGFNALRDATKMGELAGVENYVPMWMHDVGGGGFRPILPGDTRVSTRFPTGVGAIQDPLAQHLSIGLPEMQASPGFTTNMAAVRQYPGFGFLKDMNDADAARAYVQRMADNMRYLYEASPDVMKERSPIWYEGAHNIADAFAQRWGVPRPAASAGLASLSPQKEWFSNASLGERVGDIMTSAAAGKKMTSDMIEYAARRAQETGSKASPFWTSPDTIADVRRIARKSLDQLDNPTDKALWIRLYDETYNPRGFRTISPEGGFGDFVLTGEGRPSKVAWGSLGEIGKAVQSLESGGNMNVISPILGLKHKVRNFYNNIENPWDPRFGDVTGDTHAVGAGQLRAVSQNTPAVEHNLATGSGFSSSSLTGAQGTYGLLADATRQTAAQLGMLPRAAQSATWEPIRELFPREWKTATNVQKVDDIWRSYDRGEISLDAARKAIFEASPGGGVGVPSWARPGAQFTPAARGSTYR